MPYRKTVFQILLFPAILLLAAVSHAETSVWLVEKDDQQLYLGGTLHLLMDSDFPLPEEFDQAYASSDLLVLEADVGAMQSPDFAAKAMMAMSGKPGETLPSLLSPETYSRLGEYLQSIGAPASTFDNHNVGGVIVSIAAIELQRIGVTAAGVDMYYYSQANSEQKPLQFLETIDEQMALIKGMGEGIEDEFLQANLNDLEKLPEMFDSIRSSWQAGNMNALYDDMLAEMSSEYPVVYEDFMVKRNNNWIPQIEEMLTTPSTELVLVGAAHLAGPEGLLVMLEGLGYEITQL